MKSKKFFLVSSMFVVLIFCTWSYTRAVGSQITVCVKKTGLVYVIGQDFTRYDCKKTDKLLSWNSEGIQGPKGDKGDVGTTGQPGLKGDKGDKGERGQIDMSNMEIVQGNIAYFDGEYSSANGGTYIAHSGDQIFASASCPDNKVLVGGGGYVHGFIGQESWFDRNDKVILQESYPSSSTTWTVGGVASGNFGVPSTSHTMTARAYVICLNQ